jgi:methionyl-tRNA formyltransferase
LGDQHLVEAGALGETSAMWDDLEARLEALRPDLVVSWFWTRRLPVRVLARARLFGLGVHPSLLPRHRGPDPYFWTIDAGDVEAGITVHRLDEGYDTGDIVRQASIPVLDRNAWQLARALDRPALRALLWAVDEVAAGRTLPFLPQRSVDATWAGPPDGDALRVDWAWPTDRVLRRIRALAPVPGLALSFHGIEFFVQEASAATSFPEALLPGEGALVEGPVLVVRTGDGAICVARATVADPEPDSDEAEPRSSEAAVSGVELGRLLEAVAARAVED